MTKYKEIETDTKNQRKKKKGLLPVLLLIIFLASLAACGYLIYREIDKERGIQDMENNIQSFVKGTNNEDNPSDVANLDNSLTNTPDGSAINTPASTNMFDWEGLMAKSQYVVGWIRIPGIERIDYPVVQTDDNQFFLTHDWTGAQQSAGAIFMNKYNAPDFSDMNTIIYGHRMKAGSMFGLLKKYESQKFLDENPYFHIYTPDGCRRTYEILCCSHVKDGSDAYKLHFASPDERTSYYNMMIYNAVAKRDVSLDGLDTTIMLSTCNSSAGYYERIVLLGKLTEIDLNGQGGE